LRWTETIEIIDFKVNYFLLLQFNKEPSMFKNCKTRNLYYKAITSQSRFLVRFEDTAAETESGEVYMKVGAKRFGQQAWERAWQRLAFRVW